MAKSTLTPLNNEKLRNYKCNLKLERLDVDEMRNTDLSYMFRILSMCLTLDDRHRLPLNGAALSRNVLVLFGHTVGGVLTSFCTIAQTKY